MSATSNASRGAGRAGLARRSRPRVQPLQGARDLAQGAGGQLGVERRVLQLLVAEQHLDDADVDRLLEQMRREGVPIMPNSALSAYLRDDRPTGDSRYSQGFAVAGPRQSGNHGNLHARRLERKTQGDQRHRSAALAQREISTPDKLVALLKGKFNGEEKQPRAH